MKRKYTIQISDEDFYPFDGEKDPKFQVQVKQVIPFMDQLNFSQWKNIVQTLSTLNHENLIPIIKITEKKDKQFRISYDYVKQGLKTSSKLFDPSALANIKNKLLNLTEYLSDQRVQITLQIENIGITESNQPKLFLSRNIKVVSESQKINLFADYCNQLNRMFENNSTYKDQAKSVSEYSWILDKKLTQIEKKIGKLRKNSRGNISESSARKREDFIDRSPSEDSTSKDKSSISSNNGQGIKFYAQNSMIFKSNHQNSNLNLNFSNNLTNSFVDQNYSSEKAKIHKKSFGDYTTTSYRLNETVIKDIDLNHRISHALQKTQAAFKNYQRYSKRRARF